MCEQADIEGFLKILTVRLRCLCCHQKSQGLIQTWITAKLVDLAELGVSHINEVDIVRILRGASVRSTLSIAISLLCDTAHRLVSTLFLTLIVKLHLLLLQTTN